MTNWNVKYADTRDPAGSPQGRSGGADDRPPGPNRRVLLRTFQDLHQEPKNGIDEIRHKSVFQLTVSRSLCSGECFFTQRNVPQGGLHMVPPPLPVPTSAISMQSAVCKHMVSLNIVTWEMSSFSRPFKALHMLKSALLDGLSPHSGTDQTKLAITWSYTKRVIAFSISSTYLNYMCSCEIKAQSWVDFNLCLLTVHLDCLCCRHTPKFFNIWPVILYLNW